MASSGRAARLEGRKQHERRLGSGGCGERCVVAVCSCNCRYLREDGLGVGLLQANAQAHAHHLVVSVQSIFDKKLIPSALLISRPLRL